MFKTGQILGYCIFKLSRIELSKNLLNLDSTLTEESIQNNWLIIQKELIKLDIFLNWSQIVLLVRDENYDIVDKVMKELMYYVDLNDKYWESSNIKPRGRTKRKRVKDEINNSYLTRL